MGEVCTRESAQLWKLVKGTYDALVQAFELRGRENISEIVGVGARSPARGGGCSRRHAPSYGSRGRPAAGTAGAP